MPEVEMITSPAENCLPDRYVMYRVGGSPETDSSVATTLAYTTPDVS